MAKKNKIDVEEGTDFEWDANSKPFSHIDIRSDIWKKAMIMRSEGWCSHFLLLLY